MQPFGTLAFCETLLSCAQPRLLTYPTITCLTPRYQHAKSIAVFHLSTPALCSYRSLYGLIRHRCNKVCVVLGGTERFQEMVSICSQDIEQGYLESEKDSREIRVICWKTEEKSLTARVRAIHIPGQLCDSCFYASDPGLDGCTWISKNVRVQSRTSTYSLRQWSHSPIRLLSRLVPAPSPRFVLQHVPQRSS